jgi:TRAP-type C4-dicarboxylate transport system permease large subunit
MAISAFVVSGVTGEPIDNVYKGIYPYLLGMSVCLLIFLLFPEISLLLHILLMQ